jgi:AraC-like DNA-binding protein
MIRPVATIEVSAGIGALVVHLAAAKGVAPALVKELTGFDPAIAADPDARIPIALEQRLWDEAARLTSDDAFGLHAAELVRPGAFDVLDYAVRTAPTLRAALQRLVRYNRLLHDVAEFTLIERDDVTRIEHGFRTGRVVQSRHGAEFTIAAVVVIGSQIGSSAIRPRAIDFRHARPSSERAMAEHVRVFGIEPRFAQPMNACELDRASLDQTCAAADPMLSRVIERHAEALLASRPDPRKTTADRVRAVLGSVLGRGEASLSAIAVTLKTSERTLQRKLAAEGLTFDGLLDDLRRDLALRYLADPKIAIAEIAYLLGYSEPSPFHRAFKRWTGMSPAEARRRAA